MGSDNSTIATLTSLAGGDLLIECNSYLLGELFIPTGHPIE